MAVRILITLVLGAPQQPPLDALADVSQERLFEPMTLEGIDSTVQAFSMSSGAPRLTLFVGDSFRVWDLRRRKVVKEGPAPVPDGLRIRVSPRDKHVGIVNSKKFWIHSIETGVVTFCAVRDASPSDMLFSRNEERLLLICHSYLRMFPLSAPRGRVWDVHLAPREDCTLSATVWPEDKTLLHFAAGKIFRLDADTGKVQQELALNVQGVRSACFTPDGSRLLLISKEVLLVDTKTGQVFRRGALPIRSPVSSSPDGRRFVASGTDDRIRMYSTESLALETTIPGACEELQWAPGILAARDGGRVRVWKIGRIP